MEKQLQAMSKAYQLSLRDDEPEAKEYIVFFQQIQKMLQKKVNLPQSHRKAIQMDSPGILYQKLCLESIQYCLNVIHTNADFRL